MTASTMHEYEDGTRGWCVNGKWHREDGPAVENADGSREWWLHGQRHREDGPAFESADGSRAWYLNGKYHREDGPAVEHASGAREWWIDGVPYDPEEIEQRRRVWNQAVLDTRELGSRRHSLRELLADSVDVRPATATKAPPALAPIDVVKPASPVVVEHESDAPTIEL